MDNKNLVYGIGGLLVGIVLTWVISSNAVNNQNYGMMRMMGIRNTTSNSSMMASYDDHHDSDDNNSMMGNNMSGAMQGMMSGLNNKTGDVFDKAFLSEMIAHHQGAIDMANAALKNAKHQEIKDLANAIISAQTKEINQMKEWQVTWYK
jgi:uncharacterized protein (DUF305 family)